MISKLIHASGDDAGVLRPREIHPFVTSLLVAGYGIVRSGGAVTYADLLLLAAAAVCGVGYAEGSRLASEIGSTRLTCLMPLAAVPGALILCWGKWPASWSAIHAVTWAAWLYNGLGGITLDHWKPGPPITVAPQLVPGLDEVAVGYDSPLGTIRSAWRRSGGKTQFAVDIPPGAEATLQLPGKRLKVGSGRHEILA